MFYCEQARKFCKCRIYQLHKGKRKDQDLFQALLDKRIKWLDVKKFDAIPDSPFSYWAPTELVDLFASNDPFSASGFRVCQGLGSSDNFRFLRLWWEVKPEAIGFNLRWSPYAKGGGYRPHWGDQELLVLRQNDGHEIKEFWVPVFMELGRNRSPTSTSTGGRV